jgi:hypothetical protein
MPTGTPGLNNPAQAMMPPQPPPMSVGQPPAPPPIRRQTRQERMDRFRSLIDNFTYSLGSGLAAASQAQGGARRRTQAGVAAALIAPAALQRAQQQMQLQQAQEQRALAMAQGQAARDERENLMLPVKIQEALARAGLNQSQADVNTARAPLIQAQTATEQARPPLIQAQTQATTALANQRRYQQTPKGIFDLETKQFLENTDPRDRIEITPDIARKYGLPPEIIGDKLRASDVNALVNAGKPGPSAKRVVTLEDGVYVMDIETGQRERIGDRPRSATSRAPAIRVIDLEDGKYAYDIATGEKTRIGDRPATQQRLTRTQALESILADLDVLEAAAQNHKSAIGGPFGAKGKLTEFAAGMDWIRDTEISDIFSVAANLSDRRLRERSGAAISPGEYSRILKFSPDPSSQTHTQFFNNIQNMRDEVKRMMQSQPQAPRQPAGGSNQIKLDTDPKTGLPRIPK